MTVPPAQRILIFLAVSLAYAAGSRLSYVWFNADGGGATFFPAAGVTLAALVLCRTRDWPIVIAAAAIVEFTHDRVVGIGTAASLGYVLANTIEPLVGAALVRRVGRSPDLARTRDLFAFVTCAVLVAPAVGGAIGATTNAVFEDGRGWLSFATQWWAGDGLGVLVVGGGILASIPALRDHPKLTPRLVEAAALVAITIGVTTTIFWAEQLLLAFVAVGLVVWIGLRAGTLAVALAGTGAAFVAAQATATEHDFWEILDVPPDTGLAYLQLLLGMIIVSSLALAAATREREASIRQLGRAEQARADAEHQAERADAMARFSASIEAETSRAAAAAAALRIVGPRLAAARAAILAPTLASDALELLATTSGGVGEQPSLSDWRALAAVEPDPPGSGRVFRFDIGMGTATGMLVADVSADAVMVRADRLLVESILERLGQKLHSLALRAAEREALRRMELLQRVAAGVASAITPEQVARVVAEETIGVFESTTCVVYAADHVGELRILASAGYDHPHLQALSRGLRQDARLPLAEAYRSGKVVSYSGRDDGLRRFPDLIQIPYRFEAVLACPLTTDDGVIGTLAWGFTEARPLDEPLISLARALASQCSLALERARLHDVEHRFAKQLQRSMLPATLDLPDTVSASVRYVTSQQEIAVGGDWYDVVRLESGSLGIAIGDVVGRGVGASAAMGQLRSAANALARTTESPARLLTRLERFAEMTEGAQYSTALYAHLDVETGLLRYASAAHPPPAVVDASGVRFLEDGRSTPLCAGDPRERTEASISLEPGATLVFYTDGLVERRGESLDVGFARLAQALEEHAGHDPETLSDLILGLLLGDESTPDDTALLLLRYQPHVLPLRVTRPAAPSLMQSLRHELRTWLSHQGVEPAIVSDLVLATGEALSNTAEHAYPDADAGTVELLARVVDGAVQITVRDIGRWRPGAATPGRGRGTQIMRALTDHLTIDADPQGTTVILTRSLRLPSLTQAAD